MTDRSPAPRLLTLGSVDIRRADGGRAEALLGQSKRLAVLAWLAVRPGLHRRDALLALFWPESDEKRARTSLRQTLYSVRKGLGVEADDLYVSAGADEIGIAEGGLWCDAVEFERAIEAGDPARALGLYRGGFLAGFHVDGATEEFERWVEVTRRRLEDLAVRAARDLAVEAEAAGDPGEATRLAREAAVLAPSDEVVVRDLIELLDRCGDRSGALAAYDRLAASMREEFGADPSAETRALVERVRGRERPREAVAGTADLAFAPPPRPLTPIVGRGREIATALRLLGSSDARLVTLTGAAGIGKTRLAVEIAERSRETVEGVAFAPLDDAGPGDLPAAIARALGIRPRTPKAAVTVVAERIGDRPVLLVLDNFEQVLGEGPALVDLLRAAPGLHAVVASRSALNVTGEHVVRVPVLSLPDPDRRLGGDLPLDSEAVALFVQRAREVDPDFRLTPDNVEAVIEVCLRQDGLPLALELAARWLRSLPVQAVADQLAGGTGVLADGARDLPHRQRTLEDAIRWTSDLLDEVERELFRGLGAFAGEFGLAAVRSVWSRVRGQTPDALATLTALVERGLLEPPEWVDGEPRYRMLRPVRDHALRELEADGGTDAWRGALVAHCVEWLVEGEGHLCGETEAAWLARLDRERGNLRAALEWAVGRDPAAAARLAHGLWYYWWVRGHAAEGAKWLERVLEANGEVDPADRARLLVAAGGLADERGDPDEAAARMEEGLAGYRAIGDRSGVGWALQSLGLVRLNRGEVDRAADAFEEALAIGREEDDENRIVVCLKSLGRIARLEGDRKRAEELLQESLLRARRGGNEVAAAYALVELGDCFLEAGDRAEAIGLYEEALATFEKQRREVAIASASLRLADALRDDDEPAARRFYARALGYYRRVGYGPGALRVLVALAESLLERGDAARGVWLLAGTEAWAEAEEAREPILASRLARAIEVARERSDPAQFDRRWSAGRTLSFEQLVAMADALVPTVGIREAAG